MSIVFHQVSLTRLQRQTDREIKDEEMGGVGYLFIAHIVIPPNYKDK